ncbi:MAG: enoyl-CoA hydratase, partial [Pseudomonadales bacterium]|nr:enoyl-CoA hydratase [Pseudomonadales bacterium]
MIHSSDPHIQYHLDSSVFIIQMNRPDKKNALTQSMYAALAAGIIHADEEAACHVILIRGSQDCFTSGNDVSDFVNTENHGQERPSLQFMKAIGAARKPVIAAVGGLAIGIGTTLLFHCDLVYAAEDSFLQLPFTRLGLCPEAGSSLLLPQSIGHQRASELLLLGERFSAQKAQQYGIVNEVLPADSYLEYALGKARELAALPTDSVQTSKALIKRNHSEPLLETIGLE